jgi:hypothetical protein
MGYHNSAGVILGGGGTALTVYDQSIVYISQQANLTSGLSISGPMRLVLIYLKPNQAGTNQ